MKSIKFFMFLSTMLIGSAFADTVVMGLGGIYQVNPELTGTVETFSGTGLGKQYGSYDVDREIKDCEIKVHKNSKGEIVKIQGNAIGQILIKTNSNLFFQPNQENDFVITIDKKSFKNLKISKNIRNNEYKITDEHTEGTKNSPVDVDLKSNIELEKGSPLIFNTKLTVSTKDGVIVYEGSCENLERTSITENQDTFRVN